MAIWSFIIGLIIILITLVLSFLFSGSGDEYFGLAIITGPFLLGGAIASIVLGIMALKSIKKNDLRGKKLAIIGLILGIFFFAYDYLIHPLIISLLGI